MVTEARLLHESNASARRQRDGAAGPGAHIEGAILRSRWGPIATEGTLILLEGATFA